MKICVDYWRLFQEMKGDSNTCFVSDLGICLLRSRERGEESAISLHVSLSKWPGGSSGLPHELGSMTMQPVGIEGVKRGRNCGSNWKSW